MLRESIENETAAWTRASERGVRAGEGVNSLTTNRTNRVQGVISKHRVTIITPVNQIRPRPTTTRLLLSLGEKLAEHKYSNLEANNHLPTRIRNTGAGKNTSRSIATDKL